MKCLVIVRDWFAAFLPRDGVKDGDSGTFSIEAIRRTIEGTAAVTSITTTHAAAVEVADFAVTGLDASERIGQAIDRPRSKRARRVLILMGLAGGAAATYADPSIWPRLWSVTAPVAGALVEALREAPRATAQPSQPTEPAQAVAAEKSIDRPVPSVSPARATPADDAASPAPAAPALPALAPTLPEKSASKTTKQAEAVKPAGEAYAAPKAMAPDPLTRRAEAAGLHPDLSPALLQRLSDADFKTATAAIAIALKETGDTETLVWPQKAAKGAARFRVSFVHGAPDGCRRYVVEIAKDGWQTTALPIETCGVRKLAAKRG